MSAKKIGVLNLAISIFFAIGIVVSARLLKGTEYSNTVPLLLMAVWLVPWTWLTGLQARSRQPGLSATACIRRLFGASKEN